MDNEDQFGKITNDVFIRKENSCINRKKIIKYFNKELDLCDKDWLNKKIQSYFGEPTYTQLSDSDKCDYYYVGWGWNWEKYPLLIYDVLCIN